MVTYLSRVGRKYDGDREPPPDWFTGNSAYPAPGWFPRPVEDIRRDVRAYRAWPKGDRVMLAKMKALVYGTDDADLLNRLLGEVTERLAQLGVPAPVVGSGVSPPEPFRAV
jgi:hypothetical protein